MKTGQSNINTEMGFRHGSEIQIQSLDKRRVRFEEGGI